MKSPVFFSPLGETGASEREDLRAGLMRLGHALGLADGVTPAGPWGVKVHLGPSKRPAAVDPAWAGAVVAQLGAEGTGRGSFIFDTLSITTPILDEVAGHLELAEAKGYTGAAVQLPYVVADDPDGKPSLAGKVPPDSALSGHTLAGRLVEMRNLCVLTPVRPHPHAGLQGALTTLGVGLSDRPGKIALHRDIRPQVDTPLCAGCGTCMAVCLFDAITLRAGRAFIDHERCTGCGECMNACFMAGISAAEAAGIPRFQTKVADAALAARNALTGVAPDRHVYFNFLVRLDRQDRRARVRLGDVGVLAARDPVALDQATVDLISARMDGQLSAWSGFNQVPTVLLARAEAIGLGTTGYELVTV